ncbi:ParB/RepB/Spo0J family partition protein [Candidatus Magnetomonas plexicatena]|uniref:ParB/RepB/Spo0J family partition protein n=1 Tax=Candidatus Magnetomonas plexicatena TaxID=2552947 RepID=UPI001C769DAD|nr:ParB/RepB/Spo0J family partition protein [Nitrospirales bacterium LBB_01]
MPKITKELLKKGADGYISSRFMSVMSNASDVTVRVSEIVVRPQVRQEFREDKHFQQLLESVRRQGVLQPILLAELDGQYVLIAGERRLRAAKTLGFDTIPARILRNLSESDIVEIQLIENIIRQDLNFLDEALGYFRYFTSKAGNSTENDVINAFVTYGRAPERLSPELADTVSAILKISGKSGRTLQRLLTLLRLPQKVKDALREKTISLTVGYALASNVEHPAFDAVFERALHSKLTKQEAAELFSDTPHTPEHNRLCTKLREALRAVESNVDDLSDAEKKDLRKELKTVLKVLEYR